MGLQDLPDSELLTFATHSGKLAVPRAEAYVFYATFVAGQYDSLSLRPGDRVLDAGANVGDFSLLAARAVGQEGLVVAVEPNPRTIQTLKRNVEGNGLRNVRIVSAAIGAKDGRGGVAECGVGSRVDMDSGTSDHQCEVLSMDSLLNEVHLTHFDVIKMDIEGGEIGVFQTPNFLRATREIAIEVHSTAGLVSICSVLNRYGFEVFYFGMRDILRNTVRNVLRAPASFLSAELSSRLLASRSFLRYLASGAAPSPSTARRSEIRICYGQKSQFHST